MNSLLTLFAADQHARLYYAISTAVEKSMGDARRTTRNEIRRRVKMAETIVKHLRGDLSWGLERILHRLPTYLHKEIHGISWQPDSRTIWTVDDGQ